MSERIRPAFRRAWAGHRLVVIGVGVVAVIALVATGLLVATRPSGTANATATTGNTTNATASASPSASPTPSPTGWDLFSYDPTVLPSGWAYSDLDGRGAPADLAHRLPLAIMVDDNAVARPQSGISSASIVYQAPADGGEDRYMMIFQEGTATDIGPVRSARPYFVYWAGEYRALFGHLGGDVKSLKTVIPAMAGYIYNEDGLLGSGDCPYHRISTRLAPHNAYTNTAAMLSCAAARSYPATYQKLPTRTFRIDTPVDQRPAAQTISIGYHTGTIGYQYDPATDSYLRLVGGQAEIDPANGSQVFARTIAVMYQSVTIDPDSEPGYNRPLVEILGSGKATVFTEGRAIAATWKKAYTSVLTRFYDSSGAEIPFVRGEIFMQSVPIGTSVTAG